MIQKQILETVTVYSFQPGYFYLGLAIGIGLAVIGLAAKLSGKWKVLLVGGGLLITAVAPSTKYHYVKLSPDGMEMTHGAWWEIQKVNVDFSKVIQINRITEIRPNSLGKESRYRLYVFVAGDGTETRVPHGELVAAADEQLVQIATERAIPMSGEW